MASSDTEKCNGHYKSEKQIQELAKQKCKEGLSVVGKLEAKFQTTQNGPLYFLLQKDCLPSDADKEARTFICWCPYCESTIEHYTKFVRHHDKDPKGKRQYSKNLITELQEWDDGKFERRRTWKDRGKAEKIDTIRLGNGTKSDIQNESIRHNWSPGRESNNLKFKLVAASKSKDGEMPMDVASTKPISFQNGTNSQLIHKMTSSEPSQKESPGEVNQKPTASGSEQSLHLASLSFGIHLQPLISGQKTSRNLAAEPSLTVIPSTTANKPAVNFTNLTKEPPPTEMPLDLTAKKIRLTDQGQGDGQWKNEEKNKIEINATMNEAEEEESEEFATETEKESDMHFIDVDKHDLPGEVKKIEGEEKPDPPIFPNQAFLAKTIIERIAQILETNIPEKLENNTAEKLKNNANKRYKLWPLLEQWERALTQAELDNCYNDFEFVIYTAISNMLEEQTAVRMMDPLSEVFPRSLYNKSSWKTMKEEADKRVKKYHISSLPSHKELLDRVKSNPRTLFLIVADEAHVAITKKEDKKSRNGSGTSGERETETANDTMVNYWKDDEHPNVVVLQVTATPYNLLTENTRIPDTTVMRQHGDTTKKGEFNLAPFKTVTAVSKRRDVGFRVDGKEMKGRVLKLHHVKWMESHDLELQEGIMVTLKMRDIWLYGNFAENNNMSLWSGSSEIYERNPDYHFKIQGNYGMVSIRTGRDFKWKLAVISSRDSEKPFVRFVHDDIPTHGICTDEFLMDSQVGEGAFHLVAYYQSKRFHLKMEKKDRFVSLGEHEPLRRAGLVEGAVDFTFCIGQKWYVTGPVPTFVPPKLLV